MIVTEQLTINEKSFTKTYSDAGFMVERENVQYSEAIDPSELGRTYTETDIPVEDELIEQLFENYYQKGKIKNE